MSAPRSSLKPSRTNMTTAKLFRVSLLCAAALAAAGCGILKKGKGPSTPVLGQRIAVLTGEGDVVVDPATTALPLNLPEPTANADWAQSGGNPTKSMGHVALGPNLGRAFSVQAGRGNSPVARLAASPIVAGGRIYVIDTSGTVRALDTRNGGQIWASQTPRNAVASRPSSAAESLMTMAGSTRPMVLALSPRWMSATAASCGRSNPAARCVVRPPSPVATSM